MCDYLLHGIQNRLAEEGEILVVHRFYTGSKGLTSPEYLERTEQRTQQPKGLMAILARKKIVAPACAVCIPDGAKLMLHGISPRLQQAHGLSTTEVVTFRQLSANAATYRDAVLFKNGVKVCLQHLEEGQSVEVLALSAEKAGVWKRKSIAARA